MSTDYYVHPRALVADGTTIGNGTRIWAFCNVLEGARIGTECNICDRCFVEGGVVIGNRVTVKNGVSLWNGMTIEDDVFIGPHAVFTNDVYPRSKIYHEEPARTILRQGCTIGANATVIAGHAVGRYAFVGAGAVVTKDIPNYTLWLGNPARLVGYVCRCGQRLPDPQPGSEVNCRCGLSYLIEESGLIEAGR